MRRALLPLLVLMAAFAAPVLAQDVQVRPKPRPAVQAAVPPVPAEPAAKANPQPRRVEAGGLGPLRSIRPLRRPGVQLAVRAPTPDAVAPEAPPLPASRSAPAPETASAPESRPKPRGGLLGALFGGKTKTARPGQKSVKGSVCGDPAIRGEAIARIAGKVKGCGIADPVRVTEVADVRLSVAATMDCDTARALRKWVDDGLRPAFGKSGVAEMKVAAHYACRGRNNRPGARISEHGRGKAIDIAGFTLANGKEISVLRNYSGQIRKAHKAACGTFGTTLGPGSDGYHQDHLHFDTARHRNGPYCR